MPNAYLQHLEDLRRKAQELEDERLVRDIQQLIKKANELEIKYSQLKFGSYYVVEVAFTPNNPIHRAIAHHCNGGPIIYLCNSGYELEDRVVNVKQLSFFRVIEEIEEMDPSKNTYETISLRQRR